MNKQFPVLPVEDYMVVIDKDAELKTGDYLPIKYKTGEYKLHTVLKENNQGWADYSKSTGHIPISLANGAMYAHSKDYNKVIATIGKRIEGIPLIELPDEVEQLALYEAGYTSTEAMKGDDDAERTFESFKKGYKAAQSKGQYSEEDIRKAVDVGLSLSTVTDEPFTSKKFKITKESFVQIALNNKRIPTSVTLEMDDWRGDGEDPEIGNHATHLVFPHIHNPETNTIIPLKVDYE
jgi:hypothetical protein